MTAALVRGSVFVTAGILFLGAATLAVAAAPPRTLIHMTCSASSPCPTPVNAFLTLDTSAGPPNTPITVSGNSFLPGEQMSLFWDSPNKVVGSATADGNGNFSGVKVKPFSGDPPGLHHICASVDPTPCAQFELEAAPPPSPTPSPSPSDSPSPSESPSATPTGSPTPSVVPVPAANDSPNNLEVLLKPPFVFLPFIAALGLLGAIAYWAFGAAAARRRVQPLPAASVVHHSYRPQAGLPGIEYAPPPTTSASAPAPPAGPQDFTPEELQAPWPSLDRPPNVDEPEPPRD